MNRGTIPQRFFLGGRKRLRFRRRPSGIPFGWRDLASPTAALPGLPPFAAHRVTQWRVVLSSRNIPFRLVKRGPQVALYVPALLERVALRELLEYEAEGARPAPPVKVVFHANSHLVLMALLLLIVWHGVRMGWWGHLSFLPLLSPEEWSKGAMLDVYRVTVRHEWYRVVTALTLHADSQHLFGNVLFGSFFLIPLCRRIGAGVGFLLTVLAGAGGNVLNALVRPASYDSLGASTAVFGAVGVLAGLLAFEDGGRGWRRMFVPLAAGFAILGLLGTEGENTDFGAHIFGLLAGILVGGVAQMRINLRGTPSWSTQCVAGLVVVALLGGCWWLALHPAV